MVEIHESDSKKVRVSKREENEREARKTYQRRAEQLPTPEYREQQNRGIEIAKRQLPPPTYKQCDTQYNNGEVRNVYFDGRQNKFYALGFAGMARSQNTGFDSEGC